MDDPCTRSSFDESSSRDPNQKSSPPKKYRRTSIIGRGSASSYGGGNANREAASAASDLNLELTLFGFIRKEFLPLDHAKKAAAIQKQQQLFQASADLTQLPDDVLGRCLFGGFLDTFEVVRLTSVSKRIRRMASKQVERLDLRNCKHLTPTHIASISSLFQNISDVNFSYCDQFGAAHLKQLLPAARSLKHLTLRGTQVNDDAVVSYLTTAHYLYGYSRLESIDLGATSKAGSLLIGDSTVRSLSTYCPNLTSLGLAWSANVTDEGVSYLSSLTKLSKLDLYLTSLSSRSSHCLRQMMTGGRLTDLDVSATKLDYEALSKLFGFSPSSSTSCKQQQCRCCCCCGRSSIGLERLNMRFLQDLTPELVQVVLEQAPNLQALDITHSGVSGGRIRIESSIYERFITQRQVRCQGVATLQQRPATPTDKPVL